MSEMACDASLIERFARHHEEDAFALLVRRHGPRVLRVCRHLLRDEHDVEDVFQATFMLLARKASTVAWRESLDGWLHDVARRLALNVRTTAARNRRREVSLGAIHEARGLDGAGGEGLDPSIGPADEAERRELRRVLADALGQLPEKYRAPVVLCYLEGKSHEEAARQLGWPSGSMSRRLERARSLLRHRLAHSALGVAVCVGFGTLAALGLLARRGTVPNHEGLPTVRQAMSPFTSRADSGLGFGELLSRMAREGREFEGDGRVSLVARFAVESSNALKNIKPTPTPGPTSVADAEDWGRFAESMRLAALDLEKASRSGGGAAIALASRRLESTCHRCHEAFRPTVSGARDDQVSAPFRGSPWWVEIDGLHERRTEAGGVGKNSLDPLEILAGLGLDPGEASREVKLPGPPGLSGLQS